MIVHFPFLLNDRADAKRILHELEVDRGQQTVKEGAAEIVRVALLEHGPSGKFLETGGELVW